MEHEPDTVVTDSQWLLDQGATLWLAEPKYMTDMERVRVGMALQDLPAKSKSVVELRVYGHYTFQKISEIVDGLSSRSAAHMNYTRALKRMREFIEDADF